MSGLANESIMKTVRPAIRPSAFCLTQDLHNPLNLPPGNQRVVTNVINIHRSALGMDPVPWEWIQIKSLRIIRIRICIRICIHILFTSASFQYPFSILSTSFPHPFHILSTSSTSFQHHPHPFDIHICICIHICIDIDIHPKPLGQQGHDSQEQFNQSWG